MTGLILGDLLYLIFSDQRLELLPIQIVTINITKSFFMFFLNPQTKFNHIKPFC